MSRLVVVSNRVPVPASGAQAGGLAVVLDGLMAKRGGVWFGWDGAVAEDAATAPVRVAHSAGVDYCTTGLTPDEHARYYNGFSNGALWPLLHTMPELVRYERADAAAYRAVNQRLSRTLLPLLQAGDLIWAHDYHLLPLAACLRGDGVVNPIGFFLHIPFPAADVLAQVPDMAGLVRDMLAADLIGFQTEGDLSNFAHAAEALGGASRAHGSLLNVGGRRVRLAVFPVEIDSQAVAGMATDPQASAAVGSLRRSLAGQRLVFGAERLDPTKGLLQRLGGYRRLFEKRPVWRRQVTMLQIAATSRKEVDAYRCLRTALDTEAGALNMDLGDPDWTPLRLVSRNVDRALVAAYMREADVGLVTPLRDGMNLVAKEYVAAQDPEDPGVLVLSKFAGAAQQLDAALLVNPRDPDDLAEALHAALLMRIGERQARWRSLHGVLSARSPLGWGQSFLQALERGERATVDAERRLPRLLPWPGALKRDTGLSVVPAPIVPTVERTPPAPHAVN